MLFLLFVTLMLSGCNAHHPIQKAGLVLATDDKEQWDVKDKLLVQGEGNSHQVVSQNQGNTMLELVAGPQGQLEYFLEEQADVMAFGEVRLQFLSTQGTGIITLSALDKQNQVIGERGFVYTGALPQPSTKSKWEDVRFSTNFQGDWIAKNYDFSKMLGIVLEDASLSVAKYRLSVKVGQGQHVLISKFAVGNEPAKAIVFKPDTLSYTVNQGDWVTIAGNAENKSQQAINTVEIKFLEPYGYGLIAENVVQTIEGLAPGEKRHISFRVQANRPDAVNLNKPWLAKFAVNGVEIEQQIQVKIADKRPGKVFYVMTEDLEPIDGAGYATPWGNSNSWLDPQEFLGQMVYKAEALNQIADKHGAKWTHYIAWPAVKAGEWAGEQSATKEWPKVIAAIEDSVKKEAKKGHEYGIHLHSDYDPYLPGNVLSYNAATDGIWANHLKHGWAHSVNVEGDFNNHASRTGMLYRYQRILDALSSGSEQGQLLSARVGSFDFGSGTADEAMSTNVYKKVGLWGSSDANGNNGGAVTTSDYGHEIYFAAADDINAPAVDIAQLGVVEFRPTPRQSIGYDNQSALTMNAKTDQGMAFFTEKDATVQPGIHAIIGFTHAMFVMGQGDWQSTEGGQFQVIDDHLSYVKDKYVKNGLLSFATASELVESYLDYYTPQLLAVYGKRLSDRWGVSEYEIRILGKDIIINPAHTHLVKVKYPLYLRDKAYRISVLKNGEPLYSTWGLPTPFNDIEFMVDDKEAVYTLKIYHNEFLSKLMTKLYAVKTKLFKNI